MTSDPPAAPAHSVTKRHCAQAPRRPSHRTPSTPTSPTLALRYGAGLHVGRKADHIIVFNRRTGLLEEETIDPALAFSMKALYQTYASVCPDKRLSERVQKRTRATYYPNFSIFRSMGAGLMSLTAVKALLKRMSDSHGQAFSHADSCAKM